jgi:threonyl-tRNA synthetase
MIVLGEKEAEAKTLAVRKRRSKETRTINIDTFIEEMNTQVEEKQLGDTVQSI